jgi:hypothetical protein
MPVLDPPSVHETEEPEEATFERVREYVRAHPDSAEIAKLKDDTRSRLGGIRAAYEPSGIWGW